MAEETITRLEDVPFREGEHTMKARTVVSQITGCSSLGAAVRHLVGRLGTDDRVSWQFHQIGPDQGFAVHRHLATNEWVVVYDAEFDLVTREGATAASLRVQSPNMATMVHIPAGVCHTLRSTGAGLVYAVVKDGTDDFVPC